MDNKKLEGMLLDIIVVMALILVIVGLLVNYFYPLAPVIVPLVIVMWIIRQIRRIKENNHERRELYQGLFSFTRKLHLHL